MRKKKGNNVGEGHAGKVVRDVCVVRGGEAGGKGGKNVRIDMAGEPAA
jgi:hypothetical protein